MKTKAKVESRKAKGRLLQVIFHPSSFILCCVMAVSAAMAQQYPARSVRVVVPFAPGGGTDVQCRLLAKHFTEAMGQSFVVENRAGASGLIGAELVAKSPPDGYTMLCTSASLAINVTLYKKITFDPVKDLAPIGLVSLAPQFLIVHPSVPVKSVKDLVTLARRNPGKMNAGSSGSGTANHLAIEMLKQLTGIQVVHIPYKGGSVVVTALLSGEIDFTFNGALTVMPHVKSGKVRPIAVTSAKPAAVAPQLPTMASMFPGFESANWYAMFMPAGTPAAAVARVNAELVKGLQAPEIRGFMTTEGAEPAGGSPQDASAYFKREVDRYGKIIRAANLQFE
jgi:tripartite-type tricarboxylate transporter receptor subunit TctC